MSFIKDDDPNYDPHLDAFVCACIVGICLVALLTRYLFR